MPQYTIPEYDNTQALEMYEAAKMAVAEAEASGNEWAVRRANWLFSTMSAVDIEGRITPRREQLRPPGEPFIWLILGGRGAGKTRPGAEDAAEFARGHPGALLGFCSPKIAKFRDVQMEGESGLLNILPPSAMKGGSVSTAWNRSMGEFYFSNGAQIKGFSAEKPGEPRGYNLWYGWCDEPAEYADSHVGLKRNSTFSNMLLALRAPLDGHPYMVVTGTPTNCALVQELMALPNCTWVRYSMYRNAANLAPDFVQTMTDIYGGTTLGLQELYAEILDEVEGALWTGAEIEADRVGSHLDDEGVAWPNIDWRTLKKRVVGVDPSLGGEAGIIVMGINAERVATGYVIADRSVIGRGAVWGRAAVEAYHDYDCQEIVIETNLPPKAETTAVLRSVPGGATVRIVDVKAREGKAARATPLKAISQQHRLKFFDGLPLLENQMKTWVPPDGVEPSDWSPNRLDGLVWAGWRLMVEGQQRGGRLYNGGSTIEIPSIVRAGR